jgi:hypothetical protein
MMTDGPQRPGWWQASDLKWYPPERHPSYQAPHTPQPQTGSPPSGLPSYGQPDEGIAVTTKTFRFGPKLLKPKLIVDGYEIPAVGWGRTVIPTLPGRHHVHVHVPYFAWPRRIGPADTDVDVYRGRLAELEYRRPAWPYSAGSLGAGPQRYNGVGIVIAYDVLLALLLVAINRGPSPHPWPPWFVYLLAVSLVVQAVMLLIKAGPKPKAAPASGQPAAVAPGWYPDPNDPKMMRYFDGRDWSSETTPRK